MEVACLVPSEKLVKEKVDRERDERETGLKFLGLLLLLTQCCGTLTLQARRIDREAAVKADYWSLMVAISGVCIVIQQIAHLGVNSRWRFLGSPLENEITPWAVFTNLDYLAYAISWIVVQSNLGLAVGCGFCDGTIMVLTIYILATVALFVLFFCTDLGICGAIICFFWVCLPYPFAWAFYLGGYGETAWDQGCCMACGPALSTIMEGQLSRRDFDVLRLLCTA